LALAAEIAVEVDGTPGSNDMPGRIVFKTTPDGQQAPVESMRIDSSGNLQFNSGYGSVATAYGCRAWVNFDGTTSPGTIQASGNVSSVTRIGTGEFNVNFTTALPDANYSAVGSHSSQTSSQSSVSTHRGGTSASVLGIYCGAGSSTVNPATVSVAVFR
jgi:hypothetical protein